MERKLFMIEQNASTFSQPGPRSLATASSLEDRQAYPSGKRDETRNAVPCFTVTGSVTFKPMTTPERRAEHLPPDVVRLVSAISLSAAPLWHLSDCSDVVERDVPCPVPTHTPTGIPVPDATRTLTITYKTRSGRHYIWNRRRGGWVESDDGIHPRQGAREVGEGQSGTGHGGSKSGY
jgi:hypothetical protein